MTQKLLKLPSDQLCAHLGRIYDDFRTAALNQRYYARRLTNHKRFNWVYDVVVAVGSSSVIAAWAIWKIPGGGNVWTYIGGIVAALAVAKPLLPISAEIERFSKLHTGYSDLYFDLKHLVADIRTSRGLTKEMLDRYSSTEKRFKELTLQDDVQARHRLRLKCEEIVLREFPTVHFWNPMSHETSLRGEEE